MPYIGAGLTRFNTADELTVTGDAQIDTTTLVVDSTNNRVGVGTASPATALDVIGTITATTADNNPQLIIKSTDADATSGPEMELLRDSASPANSDVLGQIQFKGKNDAAETIAYAEIDTVISDVADGTEDGELRLQVKRAGTTRTGLSLGPTETVFNDAGLDNDFRVESSGSANMLFVDAGNDRVGIGLTAPSSIMHISSADPELTLTDTSTGVDHSLDGNSSVGNFFINVDKNDEGSDPKFVLNVGASDDVIVAKEDGSIGIGTASPAYLIDALSPGTGANADAVVRIKSQGTGDSDAILRLDSADTGESFVAFYNQGNNEASIEWSSPNSELNIRTESGTNGTIDIQPNNTLTARFETNGDLTLEDGNLVIGTSGHGIDFSATTNGGVSSPIELLSDYEEGEWTPTSATNTGTAATFGSAIGHYTRIGRLVHVTGAITNIDDSGASVNSDGEVRMTGLPYTIDSAANYGAVVMDNVTFQGNRTQVVVQANTAEYIRFIQFGGGDSDTGFDYAHTDSTGSDIFFSVSYYTNQ